jgi:hypothetical protein
MYILYQENWGENIEYGLHLRLCDWPCLCVFALVCMCVCACLCVCPWVLNCPPLGAGVLVCLMYCVSVCSPVCPPLCYLPGIIKEGMMKDVMKVINYLNHKQRNNVINYLKIIIIIYPAPWSRDEVDQGGALRPMNTISEYIQSGRLAQKVPIFCFCFLFFAPWACGLRFRVSGFGFRVWCFGFWVPGLWDFRAVSAGARGDWR